MTTCIICRFDSVEDDVAVRAGDGRCSCLACYRRETGATRPMPRVLRRELAAALAAAESAAA